MPSKIDLALNYWKAEKARDLEGVLECFAEDAEFRSPTMHLHGRDEVRKYYEGIMGSFADVDVTALHHIEQGDSLVVEWHCKLLGNDGKTREVLGCNVFTIIDGQFKKLNVYFNPADFE